MPPEINPYNAGPIVHQGSPFSPGAGDVEEIAYELDVDDLVEFSLYTQQHSRTIRRRQIVPYAILLSFASLLLMTMLIGRINQARFFAMFCGVAIFSLLLLRLASKRINRRYLRKVYLELSNHALLGHRRLRIAPEGLRYSSDLIDTAAKWPAVEKIEMTAEYAYLYTLAVQAYVVPRRAFSDDGRFEAFVELARRYRQQALGEAAAA